MPIDISSTSIPNELAILTDLMLSHPTVRLDQFFTTFSFLFHFFCIELELELKLLLDMATEVELETGLEKKILRIVHSSLFFGRICCLLLAGFGFGVGGRVRWGGGGCLWWRLWCQDFHLGGGDIRCTLLWLLWAQDASQHHLH